MAIVSLTPLRTMLKEALFSVPCGARLAVLEQIEPWLVDRAKRETE
jgi:hypothetical protein